MSARILDHHGVPFRRGTRTARFDLSVQRTHVVGHVKVLGRIKTVAHLDGSKVVSGKRGSVDLKQRAASYYK